MESKVRDIGATRQRSLTYYEGWMKKEGVPVIEGFGVTDVRRLQLKPWKRLGCDGAYLQFRGQRLMALLFFLSLHNTQI